MDSLRFHIVVRRDNFSCSPLSIALCNGVSIREYKAYRHMNFSLIDGCGTRNNNICGHSFSEVALVSSPNIMIVILEVPDTSIAGL